MIKLDLYLITFHTQAQNSKWIKGHSIEDGPLKLPEENINKAVNLVRVTVIFCKETSNTGNKVKK